MPQVKVLFFARAKELAGCEHLLLNMPEKSTSAEVLAALLLVKPEIAEIARSVVLAVNLDYVKEPVLLKDGDEIALIPPISGG
jgi:molybdopterin converting factor subunit 1